MPITIAGIRVNDIHIEPDPEQGYKIKTAEYSLIGSTGKVLATQTIGGYNSRIVLEPSFETKKALATFMQSYVHDAQELLGLLE